MWKKITKATFVTSSAVSIDGCFDARFTHYLVVRNLLGSSGDVQLNVRLRVASTDASGAGYRRQYVGAASTSVFGLRATGATTWTEAFGYTEATAFGHAHLRISNPFETVRTTAWIDHGFDQDGGIQLYRQVYAHDPTTSYTGLTVIPASGTITGSITVYGMRES